MNMEHIKSLKIEQKMEKLSTFSRQSMLPLQALFKKYWRSHRYLIIAFLVMCGLIAVAQFYSWLTRPAQPAEPIMPVETVRAKQQSMHKSIETLGTLSAVQEAKLKATSQGRVQTLVAQPGTWVEAGALLINMVGAPNVHAPFAGFITDFQVKAGENINTGTELVDVVNSKKMLLSYRLPEHYANQLKVGQTIEMKVLACKDKTFQASVRFVSPVIDKKTFTVLVRAELDNPDQILKSGMSAHVHHVLSVNPDALVLPEACLMPTLEGYDILLVREGKLQRQTVTIGGRKSGRVEILSGLNRDESVLLTQNATTQEGAKVKAIDWTGDW